MVSAHNNITIYNKSYSVYSNSAYLWYSSRNEAFKVVIATTTATTSTSCAAVLLTALHAGAGLLYGGMPDKHR
jgi:hypothetical protein